MRHRSVRGTTSAVCAAGILRMKRHQLRALSPAVIVLVAALGLAAPASATVITRDTMTVQPPPETVVKDCDSTVSGTLTGTGVFTFQTVENERGFHAVVTETDSGRIDWNDGSYTLIDSVDRSSFDAVGAGTQTFTLTHVDTGDTYASDGTLLNQLSFHEIQHITVTNGDIVRVQIEFGHFHVKGEGC
jgi:hypothetical protein